MYLSGNAFASGSIAGPAYSVSDSSLYAPSQVGWTTIPITMVMDVQGPADFGFWTISLNRATNTAVIVYTDSDVSGGSVIWSPISCTVNQY